MATWIITEQTARVIEREYRIEADAQDALEALEGDHRAELLIEERVLRSNVEIIDVTDTSEEL